MIAIGPPDEVMKKYDELISSKSNNSENQEK